MTELEALKAENIALKEEVQKLERTLKNRTAYWERRKKMYAREWQKDADELRALKAKLKELAK